MSKPIILYALLISSWIWSLKFRRVSNNIPRSLIESTFCIVCLLSLFLMQYDVSRLTLEVNDITLHLLTFNGSNHSSHHCLTLSITLCKHCESSTKYFCKFLHHLHIDKFLYLYSVLHLVNHLYILETVFNQRRKIGEGRSLYSLCPLNTVKTVR